MKRLTFILLSLVILLVACSDKQPEEPAKEFEPRYQILTDNLSNNVSFADAPQSFGSMMLVGGYYSTSTTNITKSMFTKEQQILDILEILLLSDNFTYSMMALTAENHTSGTIRIKFEKEGSLR